MTTELRIYVEGCGEGGQSKRMLRVAFGEFMSQLRADARDRRIRFRIVTCGSRNSSFDGFREACRSHPDAFNVLLVDSEGPVSAEPVDYLRQSDGWDCDDLCDENCHLMAQTMEAWLIADLEALNEFYGRNFNEGAIPKNQDVEQIEKARLVPSLNRATKDTTKGRYHKIRHAAGILPLLNTNLVRSKAHHCDRLFRTLEGKIAAQPKA